MAETVLDWAPLCPVCSGRSERDPSALVLDCKCRYCGWHHTSELRRAVLVALSRPGNWPRRMRCDATGAIKRRVRAFGRPCPCSDAIASGELATHSALCRRRGQA